MGDVVRTLPALQALRAAYPRAHISWLVERAASGVLSGVDELDQVMLFPREALSDALRGRRWDALNSEVRAFVKNLRDQRFDLVIDFHAILKSAVIARLCGARTRVSYARPYGREWSGLFSTHRARLSQKKANRYDRNACLLQFLAVASEVSGPSLRVEECARERMARALGGVEAPILIHPGSSGVATHKRYRPSGYADLARELKRSGGFESIVALGTTAAERALAEQIVRASSGAARLAPETPGMVDLLALIERARLFVGSDSGPLHIATALGTPAVQILGPTDPIENEPRRGSCWERVQVCVPCSPCRRGCASATCMTAIPHELVLDAVRKCLERSRGVARAPKREPSRTHPHAVVQPWS